MGEVTNQSAGCADALRNRRVCHFVDAHRRCHAKMNLVGRAADINPSVSCAALAHVRSAVVHSGDDLIGYMPVGGNLEEMKPKL